MYHHYATLLDIQERLSQPAFFENFGLSNFLVNKKNHLQQFQHLSPAQTSVTRFSIRSAGTIFTTRLGDQRGPCRRAALKLHVTIRVLLIWYIRNQLYLSKC